MDHASGDVSDSTLFEQAPCGLMSTGADGLIWRVNETLCNWIGYRADELVQTLRVNGLFSMGAKVFHQTHCIPLLQVQGSVAEVQIDLVCRDRRRIAVLMNIVRRQRGAALMDDYAFFVATDRRNYEKELVLARKVAESSLEARLGAESKLKQLNDQLSHTDRRKDEFLATLAHELRNPLAPMRNVIEILKRKVPDEAGRTWSLGVLDRQLRHLTHLVDDLMEISRITQGQLELRCAPIDFVALVHAAVDDTRAFIDSAGHTLVLDLPGQALQVDGDATRLAQVMVNLLNNAAKYTPRGGTIWVHVRQHDQQVLLSVRDTGIGIPAQSLVSVFDMFSQLAPALERAQGGLGIGLALVKGLVQLHGGTIHAESGGAGQGSCFHVSLPIHANALALPTPAPDAPLEEIRTLDILVVDDNADAADTMREVLVMLGYTVRVAHHGERCLALAAQAIPQVVILDIGLPDLNGYEVAHRLRLMAKGAGLTLIAATGWGQQADRTRAQEAGFDYHLTKPVDIAALQTLLKACMSAP
ncbi:MAG: ATP-binding protein [Janthinobacterium lividum]